jgi:hypothetical protein
MMVLLMVTQRMPVADFIAIAYNNATLRLNFDN